MPHSSPSDNGSQGLRVNSVSFRGGLNRSETLVTATLVPALCCPAGTFLHPFQDETPWEASGRHSIMVGLSWRAGQPEGPKDSQGVRGMRRSSPVAGPEKVFHFARGASLLWAERRDNAVLGGKKVPEGLWMLSVSVHLWRTPRTMSVIRLW